MPSVNSTLVCCDSTPVIISSIASHQLNTTDHQQSTAEDTQGGLAVGGRPTCCQNWSSLLLFVLVAAGVTGNTLVCCAVAVERKLRNVTNYFLVSLAVADLLVSVVVMPSCIAHDLVGKHIQ